MNSGKRSRIYGNIFLSLTVTVVLTIFILSAILYANFEQIALSLLYNTSKDNLSQVSYSVTFMTKAANSLAQQIYHDPKIANLMLFSPRTSDENEALQQMDNYRYTSTLYITSICVYSRKTGKIYQSNPLSSSVEQEPESFYDKQIVGILNDVTSYKRWEVIPRIVPLPAGAKGTASDTYNYTFLYYESVTGNKPDGAVILNISAGWLQETMNTLNSNPVQSTFIINGAGTLMTNDKTDSMLTDISKESYIRRILASNTESGYIIDNVRGVRSLVTYVSLDSPAWKFIMVTPYSSIVGQIRRLQDYTLLAGLAILVAGLLASFIIARRIYKPIDRVLERLNSLSREKAESMTALKQDYLRNLLQGKTACDADSVRQQFNKLDIRLDPAAGMLPVLLRIDRFSDFCNKYNVAERGLIKFSIGKAASEICSAHCPNEAVDAGEDYIALLLGSEGGTGDGARGTLEAIIAGIRERAEKEFAVSLSAAVGSAGSSEDLPRLFGEAAECSNYRLFRGRGCTIYAKDMPQGREGEFVYPIAREELLVNKLMLGKTQEVKEIYGEIIGGAADHSYPAYSMALLRLYSTLSAAIVKLEKSNDLPLNFNSEVFLKELNRLETIGEVNEKFRGLFDTVSGSLDDKRNAKRDDMLNAIDAVICERYADPNLCLNAIADLMGMSPVYLGRLFKALTNKSVGDHITSHRMEVAKGLLEKTNLSVGEIAGRIGILNKSHIYTLFRQEYGVTPSEYRRSCGKQDLPD